VRYLVRADAAAKSVELDIYEPIGEDLFHEGVTASAVRQTLKQNFDAKQITLRINSPGGNVIDGFAIYNLLAQHPARVIAYVDGLAASMASVILMAADEINIAANAQVMIHDPSGVARGRAKDLVRAASMLDQMRDAIADAYVARAGVARDEVLRLMDAETWLSAKDAVRLGFADTIVPNKTGEAKGLVKAAACLNAEDLKRFDNVPDSIRQAVLSRPDLDTVRKSATLTVDDIEIEVEENFVSDKITDPTDPTDPTDAPDMATLIATAVASAMAPVVAELTKLRTEVVTPAAPAVAPDFAARVSAAAESAISAGKLPNTPEARSYFASQAKDEASLAKSTAYFASAAPIVPTDVVVTTSGLTGSPTVPTFQASALRTFEHLGWDVNKLYAADADKD
jgi:ATP-dependent Clp endopeptidase proteolytic subunit ClpP